MLFLAHGRKNSAMKAQNQPDLSLALLKQEKLVKVYCCLLTFALPNGLVTMRPAERDLCSLGSLPTTKIQGKQKALVLALVAHLGGQNDDCDVSCLLRGKLTTGSPLIPLS